MSGTKPKYVNSPCSLISNSENETLFRLLGHNCVTRSSGVVQLFLADTDGHHWNKRFCGVACFVKDSNERSYFIRIFDIKREEMVWQQELYAQFRYNTPRSCFHTFEADTCRAALCFDSEDEAMTFKNMVDQKLTERHQRRLTSVASKSIPTVANNAKKGKKVRLKKEDIGVPADERLRLVGFDPNQEFEMDKLDPGMKKLLQSIGIRDDANIDKDTMEFIYDYVDKNGGIDAEKKEMSVNPPPPPLSRTAPVVDATLTPGASKSIPTVADNANKGKKVRLKKEDIGLPADERLRHVGFDPNQEFEMDKLDPYMKKLFQSIGIRDDDHVDKDTLEFIHDFVDKNGGIDAVKKAMPVNSPPPPISRTVPPLHNPKAQFNSTPSHPTSTETSTNQTEQDVLCTTALPPPPPALDGVEPLPVTMTTFSPPPPPPLCRKSNQCLSVNRGPCSLRNNQRYKRRVRALDLSVWCVWKGMPRSCSWSVDTWCPVVCVVRGWTLALFADQPYRGKSECLNLKVTLYPTYMFLCFQIPCKVIYFHSSL